MDIASPPLLTVTGLRKSFGGVEAVKDVSFDVRPGQLVALIGSNGAGKTTTFNCINGQIEPDQGRVTYNPAALFTAARIEMEQSGALPEGGALYDITGQAPRRIAKLGIGRTFQITATFASMTVVENVQMVFMAQRKAWKNLVKLAPRLYRRDAEDLLAIVGLQDAADRHTATLAYGDLKRLELAMALALKPRLLLMDEPTAGMGVEERDTLMRLTRDLAKEKQIGVLFTEHDMGAVFSYADWIIVMHRGEVIARGLSDQIRHDAKVKALYLGEDAQ